MAYCCTWKSHSLVKVFIHLFAQVSLHIQIQSSVFGLGTNAWKTVQHLLLSKCMPTAYNNILRLHKQFYIDIMIQRILGKLLTWKWFLFVLRICCKMFLMNNLRVYTFIGKKNWTRQSKSAVNNIWLWQVKLRHWWLHYNIVVMNNPNPIQIPVYLYATYPLEILK